MPRTITQHEIERRTLVAKAQQAITDASYTFTREHAELTSVEWMMVYNESSARMLARAFKDDVEPGR